MKLSPLIRLAAGLLLLARLHAQSPGSLDTNYVTLDGTDASPNFVIPLADGKVMTGGAFTNYGGSGRAGSCAPSRTRRWCSGTAVTARAYPMSRRRSRAARTRP